ncbi:hypothetical protein ARSEF1564_006168 [Beauveria bassiana]
MSRQRTKNTRHQATASTSLETDVAILNGNDDDEDDFEDAEPLFESFTHLRLNRPSTSFQGPASSDTFLRNVGKVTGLGDEHDHLDIDPNLGEPVTLPSKKRVFTPHLRLPPLHVARRLFAAQYSFIGPIFAFTESKDEFERSLFKAYVGLPDEGSREDCLHYAKLLLILAFGQMYSVNQWVDCRGPPGFTYFSEALSLLPETHEDGSLLCVETLALVGYFLQNMNKRDAAFQFIGRALRMAISLGLHHEVESISASSSFTPQEVLAEDAAKEHRRRTWWSVYSLDRILSVKSGNPITIQDEDIGVWLPSRLHSEPEYCPAIVLRQYTNLSRILGEIHKKIYHRTNKNQTKSGKTLMASVQKILIDLSNWETTYGYMDGEHIFSATIVLVMVCAAFPASSVNMSAMNTGLGLLCSMSERGNTHIGARYEVLIRLLSTVMPSGYSVPLGSMPRSPALFLAPPADPSTLLAAAPLGEPESTMSDMNTYPARFPVIDMQTLSEPFYDEGSTAGMDFGLWEEGFAYPTMDLDLDLAGQQLPADLTGDGDYGQQTASTQRPQ